MSEVSVLTMEMLSPICPLFERVPTVGRREATYLISGCAKWLVLTPVISGCAEWLVLNPVVNDLLDCVDPRSTELEMLCTV